MKRTREAIAAWDTLQEELEHATTQERLDVYLKLEEAQLAKVREAFALDTADINSRENAMLVHPRDPWLRRVAGAI